MPTTPMSKYNTKPEMGVIGYLIAAESLFLLLPLTSFLAILWVFAHLSGRTHDRRASEQTAQRPVLESEHRA